MERIASRARRTARVLGLAAALVHASGAGAATVQVKAGDGTPDDSGCGSKANPCNTIQNGVDNAAAGDVVNVAAGNYFEDVAVATPDVTLRGAGTIFGSPAPTCPGDATRTDFARCNERFDQPSCEAAWHITGNTFPGYASSCYWDIDTCRGCGPSNENAGECTNSCTPVLPGAIRIEADGVRVEKLRVRAARVAGISVVGNAADAVIAGVRVEGADHVCIAGTGPGLRVERSSVRACAEECIVARGDSAVLERNRIASCGQEGIDARGSGVRIVRNGVRLTADACVRFRGDGAVAERNLLSLCGGSGVEGEGSAARIDRNQLRATFDGIFYECNHLATSCADVTRTVFGGDEGSEACPTFLDQPSCEQAWTFGEGGAASCYWNGACRGCGPNNEGAECTNTCKDPSPDRCAGSLVAGNRATDAPDADCFELYAEDEGLVVDRNRGTGCGDAGMELTGIGIVATANAITECGGDDGDHGIEIDGEGITVERSSVRGCGGDGFNVSSTSVSTVLRGNSAQDNGQDGFDVEGGAAGTEIDGANARNNVEGGLEVSGVALDTTVTGSRASGNAFDFCDDGVNTTETGNRFGTTSDTCIPD
jgi:hypothetical protein